MSGYYNVTKISLSLAVERLLRHFATQQRRFHYTVLYFLNCSYAAFSEDVLYMLNLLSTAVKRKMPGNQSPP